MMAAAEWRVTLRGTRGVTVHRDNLKVAKLRWGLIDYHGCVVGKKSGMDKKKMDLYVSIY